VTTIGSQMRFVEIGEFPKGFTSCVKVAALATSWVFQELPSVKSRGRNGVIRFRANTKIRPLWLNNHNASFEVPLRRFPVRGSACALVLANSLQGV